MWRGDDYVANEGAKMALNRQQRELKQNDQVIREDPAGAESRVGYLRPPSQVRFAC